MPVSGTRPALQHRGRLVRSQIALHPLGSLGEHLEGVPMVRQVRAGQHDAKDLVEELVRHVGVEQVRHAVDEDAARLGPPDRLVERVVVHGNLEAVDVVRRSHRLQALGQKLLRRAG